MKGKVPQDNRDLLDALLFRELNLSDEEQVQFAKMLADLIQQETTKPHFV